MLIFWHPTNLQVQQLTGNSRWLSSSVPVRFSTGCRPTTLLSARLQKSPAPQTPSPPIDPMGKSSEVSPWLVEILASDEWTLKKWRARPELNRRPPA